MIGKNVHIQPNVVLDPSHCWLIQIGDGVTLAPGVHVLAHDASSKHLTGLTKIGRVEIQREVFVGANSTILPGVTVGENSIIGAGSVVTKDVPPNTVVSGNPAKSVCSTEEYASKHKSAQATTKCFSSDYTIENGVSSRMKEEMIKSLELNRFNYIP